VFPNSMATFCRHVSRGVLGALLFSVLAAHADAMASPLSRLRLRFTAPAGCPDVSQLTGEIQEFTEADTQADSQLQTEPLFVDAVVQAAREGFLLSLSLHDNGKDKQRVLVAPTCEEVVHAAALIIAMAVDTSVQSRQQREDAIVRPNGCHCRIRDITAMIIGEPLRCPKPETSAPPNCPSAAVVTPPQTKESIQRRDARPYRVGLSAFGSYHLLPKFALGQAVFAAYQAHRIRLEVALSEVTVASMRGTFPRTADFGLYRASSKGCWSVAGTSWFVGPCAALEGGLMRAQGHGVPDPRKLFAPWFASSVGAVAEAPITEGARLGFTADLGLPILRETYVISGQQIYKPGISGSLGISLSAGW